jgi:hypothetical protein
LGHVISGEGIVVNHSKIEAILDWSTTGDAKKVHCFMGLACYYRRFVEVFSHIVNPIPTWKVNRFEWSIKCKSMFVKLKKPLNNALIRVPNMEKDFLVCIDASKEHLGVVLMYEGGVIAYVFHKCKNRENDYATYDLELAIVVMTLKLWRHYLIGRTFELKTNHSTVKYIFTQRDLKYHYQCQIALLSEYDFVISYIKRKEKL